GSDTWFTRPVSDFVAPEYKCAKCGATEIAKEEDVLDVWFDSGSSQAAVLGRRSELTWPADAYLEAVEQARGWFGSSLVCAVAEHGQAPFRTVISHGLTLDEQGRKMSKSLGNTEDAADAVNRLGADVIRLVYASLDYSADMNLGDTIFNAVSEAYRKIRNTCRFILGNLSDFDPALDEVRYADMLEFDRFMLGRVEKLKAACRDAYERFDFQAAYHLVQNFAVVDVSSLYIDVARDRLYCSGEKSRERRSAQTALFWTLDAMIRILAPLIPYTAEEVYAHMPGAKESSAHLLTFAAPRAEWDDAALLSRWDGLLKIRGEALKVLEAMRQAGTIGAPLEATLSVPVETPLLAQSIVDKHGPLEELFIVSDVSPIGDEEAAKLRETAAGRTAFNLDGTYVRVAPELSLVITGRRAPGIKCQRCWCYFDDGGDPELCPRCRAVVRGR
ncbi:MAG TPA: class I tRNA ligase family protein, partial [Candidatus Binataceae bacterium]|nr:class I tRNA ligase family protein [Candidatus Binataceae bacterium]